MTDRLTPGQRLRAELVRALNADGRTMSQIADDAGLSPETVLNMRAGRRLPTHRVILAVSETLDAEHLVDLSIELRQRTCPLCGTPFVDMSMRRNRTWCGQVCQKTAWQRSRRSGASRQAMLTRNRLEMFQEAVNAYCRGCEPQGICRDSECSLRPVSPLAFIPMSRVRVA